MSAISNNQDPKQLVDAARTIWMRRLIDHSRANSLLFYRDLKVGTLDLTDKSQAIELLLAGNTLTLETLIKKASKPGDRQRIETESRQKLLTALIALQRKSLANLEEKGIQTLHLALGLATWPADDGGRDYAAPVILLPASISTRGRSGEDLRLSVTGEPQLNPVFLHVLESTYRIHLNADRILRECTQEMDEGQWNIDLKLLYTQVEQTCRGILNPFVVSRRAILANFQFAKMAMVEDLKKNGEALAKSTIIRAIAGHNESRRTLAQATKDLETTSLDKRSPSDDFLVLDADSTQQRAIVLVSKGQNGVIQGPPGTGKSQTIANLIAQNVAEGRRVLFVAEKRAALDAVIKRLRHPDVGLGHLILDLHGASVSRKEIMGSLAKTIEKIRQAPPVVGAESTHREFEARRNQLNRHAQRINKRCDPTGLSVNQMIGRLVRLPHSAKSDFRLRGDTFKQLTPERLDVIRQHILDGTAYPKLLLGIDPSPWNNAKIADGNQAQEALDLAITAANELWANFEYKLDIVVQELKIRPPVSFEDVERLIILLRDVHSLRLHYKSEVFAENGIELSNLLKPAGHSPIVEAWAFISQSKYRVARTRLLKLRKQPAPSSTLLEESKHLANVQSRWQSLGVSLDAPVSMQAVSELAIAYTKLYEIIAKLETYTESSKLFCMPLIDIAKYLCRLAVDTKTPFLIPVVNAVRSHLKEAGLSRLLDDYRQHNVQPSNWIDRYQYVWLHSALEHVLASDSSLAFFKGRTHEQLIADFVRLDRERVRLAAQRVQRIHAERAIEAQNNHFEQANLVRSEASKKSRHIPLRELLARAPDVLTSIAPCWVASPLSVSQLLNSGRRHFDLVVFDEASQVLQEEAVPALYRANQVVVAGDRHQLPPTTFFATAVDGENDFEDEDEAISTAVSSIGGYESLLSTLESFLPNWMLEWHYRSEDERLIGFSNAHIYSGQLITFPSVKYDDALKHLLVVDDNYLNNQEESASREVEKVIRLIIKHAKESPEETLGVITMGIKHANRIQAALDRELKNHSDLAEFFSIEREERFFVKHLEIVQGDERDAIILSIGYGKNSDGVLPHRFGPISQEVGYRRLNVAITRAKRRMTLVSSFSHHDIDLSRSGSRGVQLLKAYIEYAACKGTRLVQPETAGQVALNPFEADIRDAVESCGIKTHTQFGASRYRIDLVAMHPEKPGRPVLAIECDGASYHSSATARDRDRLRQAHLEKLGWRFHRIWSTDWFSSREQEIKRIQAAFKEAVQFVDRQDQKDEQPEEPEQDDTVKGSMPPQQKERGPKPPVPDRDNIDYYTDDELRKLALWVKSDGLLRTNDEMIREIFKLLPFTRMGTRIKARLEATVRALNQYSKRRA
jgi:very-short-patch-repair endonuclease